MGRGIILIQRFVLKIINNERKILTHHEIIDRVTGQIVLVITQVCKDSKLWIHPNLRRPSNLLIHLSSLTFALQMHEPQKRSLVFRK